LFDLVREFSLFAQRNAQTLTFGEGIRAATQHADSDFWFTPQTCFIADVLGWLIPFYDEGKVCFLIFMGLFEGAHLLYPRLEPLLLQGDAVARKYEPLLQVSAANLHGMNVFLSDLGLPCSFRRSNTRKK
jgi:hypothetical protein